MNPSEGYGPAVTNLLTPGQWMPLGPGRPCEAARPALKALTIEGLLAPRTVRDQAMAKSCLAGLWLLHNFLDEAHTLSQEIETPEGSWWHGMLHRREPDFDNARYWFRRVGRHPLFATLGQELAAAAASRPAASKRLMQGASWDPFAFIDLCAAVTEQGGELEEFCRRWQQREWELLFDRCWAAARGA